MNWRKLGDGFGYASPIRYNEDYRQVELEKSVAESDSDNENESNSHCDEESDSGNEKYTLFLKQILG